MTDSKEEGIAKQQPGFTLDVENSGGGDDEDSESRFRFEDNYRLGERIAEGSFGTVYVTQHIATKQEFAAKVIERSKLTQKDKDTVNREVSIMRDCRNVKNIVRLVDFFSSPQYFYVVQIYAEGGDVFQRLASRTTYNEKDARDLAVHLLEAMKELHDRKIAHRDLKPENLLLHNMLDDSEILVADFGFASYVPKHGFLKTRCGTPAFVAPEVLVPHCEYDERVDMWSTGCLLYMLIGGYPPFQAPNHRALFRKVRGADFCFHDAYWKNVSVSAKQLISSLLTTDPKYRCTAKMALEKSNWLRMEGKRLSDRDLSASLGELKKFQARDTLKGAVHAVLWSLQAKFKSDDSIFSQQLKDWDETDEAAQRIDNALFATVRPTVKFADVYHITEKLHTGKSSTVWECIHREKNEVFAVKIIDRKLEIRNVLGKKTVSESVMHEVAVLNALDHPYIIKIIDFFEDENFFYLIMEKMEGGDVFDRIMKKKMYTEKDARELARFLLEAVSYMHKQGFAHRDLKPQNLLLKTKGDDADIKIADFGFACRVHTPQSLTTRCGTPTYVAPEILKNIPYDESADMWSVGVMLYVLLCGHPPFAEEEQSVLFEKIRIGEYGFHGKEWDNVSEQARDLIRQLLVIDPCRRLTAKDALKSKWLQEDSGSLDSIDLSYSREIMKRRKLSLRSVAMSITKGMRWMGVKGEEDEDKTDSTGASTVEMAEVIEVLARREDDEKESESESNAQDMEEEHELV